jgi:hypothetical protein
MPVQEKKHGVKILSTSPTFIKGICACGYPISAPTREEITEKFYAHVLMTGHDYKDTARHRHEWKRRMDGGKL